MRLRACARACARVRVCGLQRDVAAAGRSRDSGSVGCDLVDYREGREGVVVQNLPGSDRLDPSRTPG